MLVNGQHYRTIWFAQECVHLIYQPLLPHGFEIRQLRTYEAVAQAIEQMWIRGAPALGAAGAYGVVAAVFGATAEHYQKTVQQAVERLQATRPTAKNLFVGIERVSRRVRQTTSWLAAKEQALQEANQMADEEVAACQAIGQYGSSLIQAGDALLTHCNAGWLACVDWGTALAPIYQAARQGKHNFVYVDETRPRGQGASLTAWELGQAGIPHAVIADNAAGYYLAQQKIQLVIVGADRIAANGDVANKIGTFTKAVVAAECGVPFYVAAPLSTIDFACPSGQEIPIEERSADEVHYTWGLNEAQQLVRVRTTPAGSAAKNPAFDVTPAKFISGIITQKGIVAPDALAQLQV